MVIYILIAISNDFQVITLATVSVLHIAFTIAVVLLAVAVTISDGQYTSDEIQEMLEIAMQHTKAS